MSDCGHTEEEHQAMADAIQERMNEGDVTGLIPLIDNDQLNLLAQAVAAEMFIRSQDFNSARHNWATLDNLVRSTLFVDSAEKSAYPEEYAMIKEANKRYHEAAEGNTTVNEMVRELDLLLTQHGVQEASRPERKDDFPGFYL